jgi:hypothetical protein
MSLGARVRTQLGKRAPRLEERLVRTNWRRRNRPRSLSRDTVTDPVLRSCIDSLAAEGYAVCTFRELFGDDALFEEATSEAARLRSSTRAADPAEDEKSSYLTKLASGPYDAAHPFVRIAIDPRVLAVANGYLGLRSHLRAVELWHTRPTPGSAVQTQLWHRDADDVMNVKMFVYITDVTVAAGPLTVAPRTHPRGDRRSLPRHDEHHRSTDEQMAEVVPPSDWRVLSGPPATVVFAETCGYHKQLKPESDERVKLVAQYVSGAPYVPSALELTGIDASSLTEDQHYAVFDRAPT